MDGIVSSVADLLGNASSLTFFDALSEDLSLFSFGERENEQESRSKSAEEGGEETARPPATAASDQPEDTLPIRTTRNGGARAPLAREASVSKKAKFAIEEFVSGVFDSGRSMQGRWYFTSGRAILEGEAQEMRRA